MSVQGRHAIATAHPSDPALERRRMLLLAEASSVLNASLDDRQILEMLARFAVDEVGDWCAIDRIDEATGSAERVTLAYRDDEHADVAAALRTQTPNLEPGMPLGDALRTKQTQTLPEIPPDLLERTTDDPELLVLLQALDIRSGVVVPIVVRDQTLGALSIARSGDSPALAPHDVAFAEELARRAGLALDKALLFQGILDAERRHRALIEHLDAIVYEIDPATGELLFMSPQIERILGTADVAPEVLEALYPLQGPEAEQMGKAVREGRQHELERAVRATDGRTVWLHVRVFPEHDTHGRPRVIHGLAIDITDRRFRDQQSLTQLAIAQVLNEADDPEQIPGAIMLEVIGGLGWDAGGLWTVAEDGHTLRCEAFATRPVGTLPEFSALSRMTTFRSGVGLPGRVWGSREAHWIEDITLDGNFPRAPIAKVEGLHGAFAFPVVVAGEVAAVIEVFSREVRPRDEELLRIMSGIGTQIGQFIERRRYESSLRDSEERMRAVVEAALDCVIAIDPDGLVVEFNPAAERTFGYRREEAVGRALADLIVPPSLRAQHRDGLARVVATGRSSIVGKRIELTGMRADGSEFPVELTITRVGHGRPLFIGFLRDIAERVATDQRREAQFEVTSILATSPNLDDAAPRILASLGEALGWHAGVLWLPDPGGAELRCVEVWHASEQATGSFGAFSRGRTFKRGEGVLGRAWQTAKPLWVEDVLNEPHYARRGPAVAAGLRSSLVVPITYGEHVLGLLELYSASTREPDEDLLRTMAALGTQVGGFIERTRGAEQLRVHRAILASQSEASSEGALLVGADGRILSRNRRFDELFGIQARSGTALEGTATLDAMFASISGPQDGLAALAEARPGTSQTVRRDVEIVDGRTFEIYTVPVHGGNGDPIMARAWYVRDVTERVRTERILRDANRRSALLTEASTTVMRSLEVDEILRDLARLLVRDIADVCVIDMIGREGRVARTAEEGRSGTRGSTVDLAPPRTVDDGSPIATAMSSGRTQRHDVAGDVGAASVPLVARGRVLGAITVVAAGATLDRSTITLIEEVAWRAALAADTARLYNERAHVAHTLQDSLLPPELPSIAGVELAARYEPAGEGIDVGGDFYDVFETARRDWAIVVGDVLGKGAEAAALTALTRYTIRAAAMSARKPKLVLQQLNEAILRHQGADRFATVAYARLRRGKESWRLTTALGGHPHPLLVHPDGTIERIGHAGTLLGVFREVQLRDRSIELSAGDTVVLYTDGVTEARGPEGMLGEPGLEAVIRATTGSPLQQVIDAIVAAAIERRGEAAADDIAVVGVRIAGRGEAAR